MTAVMPKGVEHPLRRFWITRLNAVMTAVMPKGVEHNTADWALTGAIPVMTAVMPKGVEHALFSTPPIATGIQ